MFGDRKRLSKNENDDPLAHSRMSFGDHLEELRTRLIRSIYGLLAGFGICFYFRDEILSLLAQPLLIAMDASNVEHQLYVSSLPEAFMMSVRLSLYMGIFISSPWIFYQLWGFIAAGLYPRERRYVNVFMPFSAILFLIGCTFFISIVAPISYNFFIKWAVATETPTVWKNFMYRALTGEKPTEENPEIKTPDTADMGGGVFDGRYVYFTPLNQAGETSGVVLRYDTQGEFTDAAFWSTFVLDTLGAGDPNRPNNWAQLGSDHLATTQQDEQEKSLIKPWFTLSQYVSLVVLLGLAFGIAFQMPLAVFFLGRLGLVQLSTLKTIRKYVLFGIIIGAALITPPDVISQVLLATPMYVLYEFGILLLWVWPRKRY